MLCHKLYGPTLGFKEDGNDLCICDRAHEERESYSNFPQMYNVEEEKKLIKNKQNT